MKNLCLKKVNHLGTNIGAVLVSEWFKEADCKPVIREFESHPALKYGAVAQLGERLPCTEDVAGSSPVSSTISLWKK